MPSDSFSRMDSSGSEDAGSSPQNQRARTDSESSDKQRFVLRGASGSPAQVLTMDEVAGAFKNLNDMTLAHEIAINPDFKLEPFEPKENTLEKRFKDIMHQAFWDLLREQIQRTPPCYDHAIQLLADIKDNFKSMFTGNNEKAYVHICNILDETLIKQQAEQGVLNFKKYSDFIVSIMAKSCAPIRDEAVQELAKIDDVVETFRGILELMTLMKLDLANCLLNAARVDIMANSVEYEKKKFQEYIKVYTDGFPETDKWLKRNKENVIEQTENLPMEQKITKIIVNAFTEIVDWDKENKFPEMLDMDKDRLITLQSRALRLCVCASTLAVVSGIPIISQNSENRKKFVKQIWILVQSITEEKDLIDMMENIYLHVKSFIVSHLPETNNTLDEQTENLLKTNIQQIGAKDSMVRSLLWKRLIYYLQVVFTNKNIPPPPPGFADLIDEMTSLAIAFNRITIYNYKVFGDYYDQVLTRELTV